MRFVLGKFTRMELEFTRVDRAQPEAPEGDFEQCAKASNAVDAGLGDEAHGKGRTVHDGDV